MIGRTRKTTGTIWAISFLHEGLTGRLTNVGGLGAQDVGKRCAALKSHDDRLAQTGDVNGAHPALHTVQGSGQDGTGTDVGQGDGQFVDKVATSERDDALNGGHRPLTGSHGQSEELDDVGQLGLDPT